MFVEKAKETCLNYMKNHFEVNRKRAIAAVSVTLLLVILWKFLPKGFSTLHSNMIWLLLLDCLLCLSLTVKVKETVKGQDYFAGLLLFLAPAVCFFNMEYVVENPVREMVVLIAALSYAIYFLVFLVFYAVTGRIKITVLLGMTVFTVYALTNSFVKEFRGNGIRTADIFSIRTAMNVSKGYELIFTFRRAAIILIALAVVFLAFHCEYRSKSVKSRIGTGAVTLAYILLLHSIFWNKTFMEENWIVPYKWEIQKSAQYHGAFLEFAAGIPYLSVEKPEGYSAKKADEMEKTRGTENGNGLEVVTALDGKKPDIIVIMNESFSDLSILGEFQTDQEYLEYFHSLKENVIRGNVSVPIFGGLTANTEFEFMTGFSNTFFPAGIIPYQNYVKKDTPNLNRLLKDQGYYSLFMHPMNANGWNRRNVYRNFGFDESCYIDDFVNRDTIRGMISDRSNYREVIERYEKAKENSEQVFLFNVTMQNHGGYATGMEKTVHLTDLAGSYPKTEEYLSLMRESDEALKELIAYFSTRENPVLICIFGDHQPSIETEFYDEVQNRSGDGELQKQAKKYQTPFLFYANYDIEESVYENISINYLQSLLMEAADLPLDDYQKYLEGLYEKYPVVNLYGVMDKEGNWYNWTDAQNFPEIQEYAAVQYRNLFD